MRYRFGIRKKHLRFHTAIEYNFKNKWRTPNMFEEVKNLLVDNLQLNPDEITMKAELINDLGVNSLELADLILLCEERFDVEISDDEIHKFVTVGDVVNYLSEVVNPDELNK